jgi:hypothetical protein
MTMNTTSMTMSDDVVWEGHVGKNKWIAKIHRIAPEMYRRGILRIYSLEGEMLYQKEVPVDLTVEAGGTMTEFQEWNRTITSWVLNNSPSHPQEVSLEDPEE